MQKKENNDIVALKWEMTLSPETMFEQMIGELEIKPQKEFRILKSHLNHNTMSRALVKKPKILVINCHGGVEY